MRLGRFQKLLKLNVKLHRIQKRLLNIEANEVATPRQNPVLLLEVPLPSVRSELAPTALTEPIPLATLPLH